MQPAAGQGAFDGPWADMWCTAHVTLRVEKRGFLPQKMADLGDLSRKYFSLWFLIFVQCNVTLCIAASVEVSPVAVALPGRFLPKLGPWFARAPFFVEMTGYGGCLAARSERRAARAKCEGRPIPS